MALTAASTSEVSGAAISPESLEDGSLRAKRQVSASLELTLAPIMISYCVSLTVKEKMVSETGKAPRKKVILDNVCGTVCPGQMLAIMGPSGAGKTSLLNCLSLRNTSSRGYVLHNGKAPDIDTVGIVTSFVQQEDLFIPTLTPREHLRFHASMRMSASLSREEKMAAVEDVLDGLGLGKCADTPIGGQGGTIRGISGGEKKRLSFATEILGDASVLFVDEPTSGLDSFMAEAVVQKLGDLAAAGRTVIATIHQPSSQVFGLFSNLHLLAEGKTIFCGPLADAKAHFDSIGHPCPSFYNPADHYIRVMSWDPAAPAESEQRIEDAVTAFKQSDALVQIERHLPKSTHISNSAEEAKDAMDEPSAIVATKTAHRANRVYQASWSAQMAEVYKRTIIMYRREPVLTRVRLAQAIMVAVVGGLIFLQLGQSQADVQSMMGLTFFVTLNQGILGTIGVLQVFPNEMPVFLREYDAGAYRVGAYFFGRTLAEIPIQIIFPAVFSVIVYFMVGLPISAKPFFLFVVFVVLTANAAVSLGYVVSAMAKNVDVALAIGPMILLPLIIFGGLLINLDEIPAYFLWFSSFSFVQYGFRGASIAIWEDPSMDELDCPEMGMCSFPTGQSVLDYLSIDGGNRQLWINTGALLALTFGFRLLAYFALLHRSRPAGDRAY